LNFSVRICRNPIFMWNFYEYGGRGISTLHTYKITKSCRQLKYDCAA
jgi:hypothetical protein